MSDDPADYTDPVPGSGADLFGKIIARGLPPEEFAVEMVKVFGVEAVGRLVKSLDDDGWEGPTWT